MEQQIPIFLQLSRQDQKASIESLIFASEEPLTLQAIFKILNNDFPEKSKNLLNDEQIFDNSVDNDSSTEVINISKSKFSTSYVEDLIDEINHELLNTNRPFQIVKVANGYQYATRQEFGELLARLHKSKSKKRLSQATLEVLSIITYKQPVSKPEIEQIRGVNSNEIVNTLIEKNLIEIKGRSELLGKPLLYGTTDEFLKIFGLNGLEDLPKLRELEDLSSNNQQSDEFIDLVIDIGDADKLLGLNKEKNNDFVLPEHSSSEVDEDNDSDTDQNNSTMEDLPRFD